MPLEIIRNDITNMDVDVIVNSANTELLMGGGVCGAIFSKAGAKLLQEECKKIGYCNVGEVVLTKGYNLTAKYIIHAVGPIWNEGESNEKEILEGVYRKSLYMAVENGLHSIAFPLISSGIYGYPKDQVLHIATSVISEFLLKNDLMVYLVVFDEKSFTISEKLFKSIESYIDNKYTERSSFVSVERRAELYHINKLAQQNAEASYTKNEIISEKSDLKYKNSKSLEDVINNIDESFSQMLLRLIDEKGKTDTEVYKKANIDRKLFSKIRSQFGYNPSKQTAIALAISIELNLDETLDLLSKAGYTLSHSNKFDIIIEYFITEKNYNIYEINEALFTFEQPLLGA